MYYFSIKDLAILTGINAPTLRTWEQRHGLLQPKQTKSNHRMYSHGDLKKLFHISILYLQGAKIARLAAYSPHALVEAIATLENKKHGPFFYELQLLEHALLYAKEAFSSRLECTISKLGFETTITDVCYPLLQKLELLLKSPNEIRTVLQFCSVIIQHNIIAQTETLPLPPHEAPEIVLFSPQGSDDAIPLYFINYLLRKGRWTTLFLGVNVRMKLLEPLALQKNITHSFIHVPSNATRYGLDDYFSVVCKLFASQTIVASGKGIFSMQRQFTNLVVLTSDAAIYQFALKSVVT